MSKQEFVIWMADGDPFIVKAESLLKAVSISAHRNSQEIVAVARIDCVVRPGTLPGPVILTPVKNSGTIKLPAGPS